MVRWMLWVLALMPVAFASGASSDGEKDAELQKLRERVSVLEQLVKTLQAELASLKGNGTAPSNLQPSAIQQPSDEERRKLEQELQKALSSTPPTSQPSPTPPTYGAVVFGGGAYQALNPDTSVIANFRAAFRGRRPFGAFGGSEFSEAELAFQAATDPFSRLDTFVAVGPDGAEIEEATLSILDPSFLRLPKGLQIKLGLLRSPFGQLNNIHPPEQPLVDTPLVHRLWFSHLPNNQPLTPDNVPTEGSFTGTGLSLNWLLPTGTNVTWLTLAPLNVDNFTFNADAGRPVWMARLRHLRELSETQTLSLGISSAFGRNDTGNDTRLFGVDFAYRWRPIKEGLYRSLVWQTEAYFGRRDTGAGTLSPKGWFSLVEYQLSRTLFLGLRYDFAQAPDKSFSGRGFSLALTLFPSEFGRYRLQWNRLKLGGQTVHEVWLQTTFSIGVHRPHPL
ncbi:MAG: hypothetical protein RJAPGHWK_002016 [Candidatus Fervidibacter sp.]